MKTNLRKKTLLASAAIVALGLSVASPAKAFDEVNWTWESVITEDILSNITVDAALAPTGMMKLEKIQAYIGDLSATSTVTNIVNNPPTDVEADEAPAPAPSPVVIDLKAKYDDNAEGNPITSLELLNGDETGYSISNWSGHVNNNREKIFLTFDLLDENPAEAPDPDLIPIGERDAIDLPQVASAATAVGNNQDLESSVAVELHDAQYFFGGFAEGGEGALEEFVANVPDLENSHTEGLVALALAAGAGLIEPATVSADSSVTAILNASVDSTATAVGNNFSLDLQAFSESDAMMMGDATQFAYADLTATSLVDDVTAEGYGGFGAAGMGPGGLDVDTPQIPLVNSAATAIGNNFSVTINSTPDVDAGL